MITSFIPGRLRLRDARFKDEGLAAALAGAIGDFPGVSAVTGNPRTGSLLVEYDPERVDLREAGRMLAAVDPELAAGLEADLCPETAGPEEWPGEEGEAGDEEGGEAAFRQGAAWIKEHQDAVEYAAMIGAFVVCASSAFLRSRGWHVYSGLTLAGLTLQHIYKYRRRLASLLGLRPPRAAGRAGD